MCAETEKFAVIDTETTWGDDVMSIGVVLSDSLTFSPSGKRYYILLPCKHQGGMFSDALYARGVKPDLECGRPQAADDLRAFLEINGVRKIFAYNALFDFGHLPELAAFEWYDIMRLAAYRQFNKSIPPSAGCYSTGRLKRGYGVENIYRMLSGDPSYSETHNALFDARDELTIMKMLGAEIEKYDIAGLKTPCLTKD